MEDPNGKEAGIRFLEENKSKERVVTLASGLQYKVLREGRGMDHPKANSPCDCHYKGRLLDGTEFDSSYARFQPTTFAPNQVIKGWTEAMQMMVQGDKWEMYISYTLAYGESGKPPKIPGCACLIFVMEIMKIKGETVPAQITFPEWTPDQIALWGEKDEASLTSWRETREKSWSEGPLKEQHPVREEFEAWMAKQCKLAKDKSLWKRTRKSYEDDSEAERPVVAGGSPDFQMDDAKRETQNMAFLEAFGNKPAGPEQLGVLADMKGAVFNLANTVPDGLASRIKDAINCAIMVTANELQFEEFDKKIAKTLIHVAGPPSPCDSDPLANGWIFSEILDEENKTRVRNIHSKLS